MRDKERILMMIITRIIPGVNFHSSDKNTDNDWYIKSNWLHQEELKNGDLVFTNTTRFPNEYMVGFVDHVETDCVVIREIGSDKLCKYSNESFTIINKEKLGYEILEGIQYKIYEKVLKAFADYTGYWTHFRSIDFDGNKCIVTGRNKFENEISGIVEFEYNSKTTVKYIGELLKKQFGN